MFRGLFIALFFLSVLATYHASAEESKVNPKLKSMTLETKPCVSELLCVEDSEKKPSSVTKRIAAVDAGLQWLLQHQHKDGHWSSDNFTMECKDPKKTCKTKKHGYNHGRGFKGLDVGVTGLALMAFVHNGITHKAGKSLELCQR